MKAHITNFAIQPFFNSQVALREEADLYRLANRDKGFLIVFEGPDGSGKSTQLKRFRDWLTAQGHDVMTTKWKSAPVLSSLIKSKKETRTLSPQEYCLLHAADFLFRLENVILPALRRGKIVLCDRYVFTALTRDVVRGLDKGWVLSLYEPVLWPDLVLYFSVSAETALERIRVTREPKYYEAGQDVTHMSDPSGSFKAFIRCVIDEYEQMAHEHKFLKIDAERSIVAQQRYIRTSFQERWARVCAFDSRPSPKVHRAGKF